MKTSEILYLGVGMAIGVGVVFYQIDTPRSETCGTYKVAAKSVTAYVLKPPAQEPIVLRAACPQVTEKAENITEPEIAKADESKPPHRHRRHRVRRYGK